jgi:hypothetical protein
MMSSRGRRGELLKQIDARGAHMKKDGAGLSQRQAADDAGLSERQAKTAVRVASVPKEEFEAAAKRRLADEYDAAQERGEVAATGDTLRQGPGVPEQNAGKATAADLGLSHKDIHEARIIRDAGKANVPVGKHSEEV